MRARKTIPTPHGTRERLIEMKPCERNIPWGEFYGGKTPSSALSQISFKPDFMQTESPPPINDYDFSGIGSSFLPWKNDFYNRMK